ncbi:MAG: hypothetical protein IJZ55_03695 [Lachnospiraceae bacterium]|nr:hypothetical protein [Lachnospiraceae bacterium]
MEKGKIYTYQGFTFTSEAELNEAKKEAEVVSYIRSQADLGNTKTVIKLYNRLIEKGTLVTTLGIAFLQELRSRALESGVVAESSLKPLPQPVEAEKIQEPKKMTKDRKLMELYKQRCKTLTIVVVALCVVIVGLFVIRLFGTASPYRDYEKQVLNDYAGWKEELTIKEEELHQWEQNLTEKERILAEWEVNLTEREEKQK